MMVCNFIDSAIPVTGDGWQAGFRTKNYPVVHITNPTYILSIQNSCYIFTELLEYMRALPPRKISPKPTRTPIRNPALARSSVGRTVLTNPHPPSATLASPHPFTFTLTPSPPHTLPPPPPPRCTGAPDIRVSNWRTPGQATKRAPHRLFQGQMDRRKSLNFPNLSSSDMAWGGKPGVCRARKIRNDSP